MIFNLKINAASDELNFKPQSALVKFLIESDKQGKVLDDFFSSFNFNIGKLQKNNFFSPKSNELIYFSHSGEPALIIIKKVKLDKDFSIDFFRNYFAGLIQDLTEKNISEVHVITPLFNDFKDYFSNEVCFLQSMIEGIYLGNYSFDNYKLKKEKPSKLSVFIHYTEQKLLNKTISSAGKLMEAIYFTRDLVNEPSITLTPNELANQTKKELTKLGVKVIVFNKAELKRRKMNAILTVGEGSDNPPCLITMHYKPGSKVMRKIALVGKGVTYDSGGLSIKPTAGLLEMKADMAGGAAVIGIIKAAALMKLPVELIGIVPAVENMIAGSSYKPSDIIISSSGKSIEVKDTDAEGRIVLADALHYASQQKPDEIIDLATLTGACVVALGEIAAGLFSSYDRLAEDLLNAGRQTYERLWRMPFWKEFADMIKSDIADVSNLGPRWGGAITAGKFLEHFVGEKIPWAHIDIAGPAIKHKSTNYTEKYDTGFGVRLLVNYLMNIKD
jgi:leucyl aminopeptidase